MQKAAQISLHEVRVTLRLCVSVKPLCKSFIVHIGADEDIPAGDIGVGGREVGYMFGQYKKLTHVFTGVLTGKGKDFGGSNIRPEATGYGNIYFLQNMLKTQNQSLKGKRVLVLDQEMLLNILLKSLSN